MGATQVKIAAGGSVTGKYDPLDSLAFTNDELKAAVEAAFNDGTYVMAHIYKADGIRRALDAGVMSIEHGQLIDEPTMILLKNKHAWLSTQAFVREDALSSWPEDMKKKYFIVCDGTDNMFKLVKEVVA